MGGAVFIGFFLSGTLTTLILIVFNVSHAAFRASLFVRYVSFNSIHGKASSAFIITIYNFTITEGDADLRSHIIKTLMNFEYLLESHLQFSGNSFK
jgi:hypothetical protein